ncbi:unnamed protein product [Spirodela intermedia]|uniref:Uncharacterized protein n=1 Tax=Spirodela intermedia TaxID=51605 RepID=A0A7I8KZ73_SPIIN|nr:unnamed protein product [Spirodela intermedia]
MHVYLSVINKYTVIVFGFPAVLTGIQYATSAGAVWVLGGQGFLTHNAFSIETAKKFLPRPSSSTSPIFIHTQLLLVIDADAAFRKQPFPSKLLFTSLVIILGGLVVYVATGSIFFVTAYAWATAYLLVVTTGMVHIKHIVINASMGACSTRRRCGRCSCRAHSPCRSDQLLRFGTRKAISATVITLTGVVNKLLTVAVNVVIWSKQAAR